MHRRLLPIAALVLATCSSEEPEEATCPDCFAPPAAVCDADTRVTYTVFGVCIAGQCAYPEERTDCLASERVCENGDCVLPPDPCEGTVCDSPPADTCSDDQRTALQYGTGECVGGACDYVAEDESCRATEWCIDGACVRQPCAGIECSEPPDPACEGDVATRYVANGECIPDEGICEYDVETSDDCEAAGQFCESGACVDFDPCLDVICDVPPAQTCEGNTLTAVGDGFCNGGDCVYPTSEVRCADAGQLCRDGECRERLPCEDVVCDDPPADFCDTPAILVQHPAVGECADEDCAYLASFVDCAAGSQACDGGRCIDPTACTGVVCDEPPAPVCEDDVFVLRYEPEGECTDGMCHYPELRVDCADEGGSCVDDDCDFVDICAGVICTLVPDAICVGSISVIYGPPGVCDAGECEFFEDTENCALSGDICADGICQDRPDPCDEITCPALAPTCDGTDRLTYSASGVCLGGACDYSLVEFRTPCEGGCDAGLCVSAGTLLVDGDVIISEILANPNLDTSYFFELQDMTGNDDLSGLQIVLADGAEFVVPDGTTIEPLTPIVIGASALAAPHVDLVWDGLELDSASGSITLIGAETVDALVYDVAAGFPDRSGRSAQRSGVDRDDTAWCESWEEDESIHASSGRVNGSCGRDITIGELFFTEIMSDGVGRLGGAPEVWFELYSDRLEDFDLNGLIVRSDAARWVIRAGTAEAEDFSVFGFDGSVEASPSIYWNLEFSFDAADALSLENGSEVLDAVGFSDDTWPLSAGVSMALLSGADHMTNDEPASWCASSTPYGRGVNRGTPADFGDCDE